MIEIIRTASRHQWRFLVMVFALCGWGTALAQEPSPINRLYTVAFGTQALTSPLRVSESVPLVSRMVTLPKVSCPDCNSQTGEKYTYDVIWEADRSVLDIPHSDAVSGAGTKHKSWVFRTLESGQDQGIEIMMRYQDRNQGLNCQPATGQQGQLQCQLTGKQGVVLPEIPVEVGLMVLSQSVMPGDLKTLNRAFLTRVVTFRKGREVISQYRDAITVSGSTTVASCNISTGEMAFNLPARGIIEGTANSIKSVSAAPPTDAVERSLTFSCIGNTRLDIRFTALTGTLDDFRVLRAQSMQGVESPIGFQLWYQSSEWANAGNLYRLAKWDGATMETLLAQSQMATPRLASAPDIVLKFRAGYAKAAQTKISAADAGPIMARGLYTISYQ